MDVDMKTNTADALDVDVEEVMGMVEFTEAAYMAGEEASHYFWHAAIPFFASLCVFFANEPVLLRHIWDSIDVVWIIKAFQNWYAPSKIF